jgi:hypothetical protein
MKMLLHEWRYVLWVLMNAPTISAAKAPSRPGGSRADNTRGPRIWPRTASLSMAPRRASIPAVKSAQSGWWSTVKTRIGTRVMNMFWEMPRHRPSTPPILPSWAVRAELL